MCVCVCVCVCVCACVCERYCPPYHHPLCQAETHDKDGSRVKYFHDEDQQRSVRELVEQERLGMEDDVERSFVRMAGKNTSKIDDEDFTMDDMYVEKIARKEGKGKAETRERQHAINGK